MAHAFTCVVYATSVHDPKIHLIPKLLSLGLCAAASCVITAHPSNQPYLSVVHAHACHIAMGLSHTALPLLAHGPRRCCRYRRQYGATDPGCVHLAPSMACLGGMQHGGMQHVQSNIIRQWRPRCPAPYIRGPQPSFSHLELNSRNAAPQPQHVVGQRSVIPAEWRLSPIQQLKLQQPIWELHNVAL